MGGKFYGSIRVSFANACVSNGYKTDNTFGFDVLCATIFFTLLRGGGRPALLGGVTRGQLSQYWCRNSKISFMYFLLTSLVCECPFPFITIIRFGICN